MQRLLEWNVERLVLIVGGALLVGMMLLITIDVVLRGVTGVGFPATSDIVSRYQMVAISFLPIALAEVGRQHVEATVFVDRLPARYQALIIYFGLIASFTVYAMLTYATGRQAVARLKSGAFVEVGQFNFLTWPSYWIVPVSFFIMTTVLVLRLLSGPRAHPETNKTTTVEDY